MGPLLLTPRWYSHLHQTALTPRQARLTLHNALLPCTTPLLTPDGARRQLAGLSAALERERDLHESERERMAAHVHELETRVQAERLGDAQRSVSELEEQLAAARAMEEAVRTRLSSATAAAQAEVERGTSEVAELHDARERQLRLEHSQLAELHAQSSSALKAMADQREALKKEAEAHRRTQEQLLSLHETMQKERDAFAAEMANDRDARAQLPIVLAELASTRKLLEKFGHEAAERLALGKDDQSPAHARSPSRSPGRKGGPTLGSVTSSPKGVAPPPGDVKAAATAASGGASVPGNLGMLVYSHGFKQ